MSLSLNSTRIEQASLPDGDGQSMIQCFIIKFINHDNLALHFNSHRDTYSELIKEMARYYRDKTDLKFIKRISNKNEIFDSLFILNWGGEFFRATIIDSWSNGKYLVFLIDLGFNFLAHEDYLFLNDNDRFLRQPILGFVFNLKLNILTKPFTNAKHRCILNYLLQITATTFVDFFIKFDWNKENVSLFYKNNSNKIVSIDDLVRKVFDHHEILDGIGKNFENYQLLDEKLAEILKNDDYPSPISGDVPPTAEAVKTEPKTEHGENSGSKELVMHALLTQGSGLILMKVKQIINPHYFYLKFAPDNDYEKLKNELETFFIIPANNVIENDPEIGRMYAVQAENGKFVRALLLSGPDSKQLYHCFLVDEGREDHFNSSQIYLLSESLKKYPPKSVRAKLDFVKPANETGTWDSNAVDYFRSQLYNRIVEIIPNKFDADSHILNCNLICDEGNFAELMFVQKLAEMDL